MTPSAFKIMTTEQWAAFEREGVFVGSPVDAADGFIHLSTGEQLPETLDKHFAGQQGLKIVEIDLEALGEAIRWEESRGGALFPHLYTPLPMAAVRGCRTND